MAAALLAWRGRARLVATASSRHICLPTGVMSRQAMSESSCSRPFSTICPSPLNSRYTSVRPPTASTTCKRRQGMAAAGIRGRQSENCATSWMNQLQFAGMHACSAPCAKLHCGASCSQLLLPALACVGLAAAMVMRPAAPGSHCAASCCVMQSTSRAAVAVTCRIWSCSVLAQHSVCR